MLVHHPSVPPLLCFPLSLPTNTGPFFCPAISGSKTPMLTTATPFFAASPSPSWRDVTYVHYTPCLFPSSRVLNLWFSLCSIAESAAAFFVVSAFTHDATSPCGTTRPMISGRSSLSRTTWRARASASRPRTFSSLHDQSPQDPGRSCTALLVQPRNTHQGRLHRHCVQALVRSHVPLPL